MKHILPLLTALLLAPLAALHATTPTAQENSIAKQWTQSNVFADNAKAPFSFSIGGTSSSEVLRDWKRTDAVRDLDAQRRERTRTWTDGRSGLQVRLIATEYAGFPVVEWTLWLKNTGKENTPLIENIQGLDTRFERRAEGEFVLHGLRGDSCLAESFRPYVLTLGPDPSVPIMGETVASLDITVEGQEVEGWRNQGCWG